MNNKGIFEILKKGEKYSIVYIEKGDTLDLSEFDSKFSFDNYDAAKSYIDTNKDSLDAEVTKIKDNIRKLSEDKGLGVLITDHNPKATLSITDRAYVIFDGKIKIIKSTRNKR